MVTLAATTPRRKKTNCLYEHPGGKPLGYRTTEEVSIRFDPAVQMPGCPTLAGHRLGAIWLAEIAWRSGIDRVTELYPQIEREQVAVCCWWAGLYGSRTWRKRYGEWARTAGDHMWYRCAAFPDPPTAGGAQ